MRLVKVGVGFHSSDKMSLKLRPSVDCAQPNAKCTQQHSSPGGREVALTDSKLLSSGEFRVRGVNEAVHERQFVLDVITHC